MSDSNNALRETEKTANELAEDRTNLAYDRTALANDRTLIAWVRTSVSLFSFGFTIFKFFEDFSERPSGPHHMISAKQAGLMLICLGALCSFFGLLQYNSDMKRIRSSNFNKKYFSFAPTLASVITVFSLVLLFGSLIS